MSLLKSIDEVTRASEKIEDVESFLVEINGYLSSAIYDLRTADSANAVDICHEVAEELNGFYQRL